MNQANRKKRFSVTVPKTEHSQLKELADQYGFSLDSFGAVLIEQGLKVFRQNPTSHPCLNCPHGGSPCQ